MSQKSETASESQNSPSVHTLMQAAKMALEYDRPIMLDYYGSHAKVVKTKEGDTLLYKSNDEYTSPISRIYKVESEYIIVTENSIYLVSSDIDTKRIS